MYTIKTIFLDTKKRSNFTYTARHFMHINTDIDIEEIVRFARTVRDTHGHQVAWMTYILFGQLNTNITGLSGQVQISW